MDWMALRVERKILISDAKVPLSWVRNKNLRTQPYVQNRVHNICKIFDVAEAYYIKSEANPSDLGTKFDKFNDVHLLLGEDSRFRNGPACLKKGIEAAVASGELVPLDQITLNAHEKAMAALEIVKMNQLVIIDEDEEDTLTLQPNDAVDKETIDLAIPCLITATNETISEELLLKPVSSGYRAQKATKTIRDKVAKV